MSAFDSYMTDMAASEDNDDLDSLPSISSGVLSSEADSSDAQKEWEESLEQIQLLLTMIVVPFAGKFLGRKFAYWSTLPLVQARGRDGSRGEYRPLLTYMTACLGWARYMEWMHNVEIRWTSKKTFNATGAAEAAATL